MVGADRRNTRFLRRSLGGGRRFVVGDWGLFIVVGDFSTLRGLRLTEFTFSRRAVFSSFAIKWLFFVFFRSRGDFRFIPGGLIHRKMEKRIASARDRGAFVPPAASSFLGELLRG